MRRNILLVLEDFQTPLPLKEIIMLAEQIQDGEQVPNKLYASYSRAMKYFLYIGDVVVTEATQNKVNRREFVISDLGNLALQINNLIYEMDGIPIDSPRRRLIWKEINALGEKRLSKLGGV